MKNIIAVGVLAVLATPAFADDSGFYIGVDAGSARAGTPSSFAGSAVTTHTKTVVGILAGYQFDKNWGVEAKYTGAGEVSIASTTAKTDVYSLSAIGTLPLADAFSLYGKLGYASAKTSVTTTSTWAGATRSAVTYGLGGQYNVTPAVGIRLGWDRYSAAIVDTTAAKNNYDNDVYTIGAVFKF